MLRFGEVNRVVDPGAHFKIPLVEQVVQISVRVQKTTTKTEAASRDLQVVETTMVLNYNLKPARAEAEALRLQRQVISPELLQLRQIEAQIKAIEKGDGKLPNVTGGAVPFIQVDKQK
ncbi:MAG: hypothetical protein FD159_1790 [Syntrophaceae bacterium]|nr:MAG: hypothetical protein FD159_1790 [Syntrophaceae bacterium]